jgi:hypothetical protein
MYVYTLLPVEALFITKAESNGSKPLFSLGPWHNSVNPSLIFQEYSVTFSPQAIYTDWATTTCWRILVPTFVDRGMSRGQRGGSLTVINLSFLDRSRYFSFK